ncbi:DNA repair protein RadA [Candidatus Poribacteria bacterium]|nr:DNA repair protein RadA [Candidatus Poribacteria bacterium]
MPKEKTRFVCQECGNVSPKWMGKCPDCGKWNSFIEEAAPVARPRSRQFQIDTAAVMPVPITKITASEEERLKTGISEFDRVLGGGVVPGSIVLVGGDPGIGKSTLMLQATERLSQAYGTVLYVSGEESASQTKLRANRLGVSSENLYVLCETSLEAIETHIEQLRPKVVVIDSIQTVYRSELQSTPGSISQIKASASQLMLIAKGENIPILLVGHVTKGGALAGPKVLEHMVDTVLYFEGERQHIYRILRAVKNRFGSTNEIGIFEMLGNGLAEVKNPSEMFLSERQEDISGSVVVSSIEGTRPLLLELQALVAPANLGVPRSMTTGVDRYRISMLLAVLEKRVGLQVQDSDVYVNITGGVKVTEPGIDLGIVIAIASNYRDLSVDSQTVIIGEVGLGGEVRAVSHVDKRIREAAKLGFKKAVFPEYNKKGLEINEKIELIGVKNIYETLSELL